MVLRPMSAKSDLFFCYYCCRFVDGSGNVLYPQPRVIAILDHRTCEECMERRNFSGSSVAHTVPARDRE